MMHAETKLTLNIRGRLRSWDRAVVMGIINITPDSFHSGSRVGTGSAGARAAAMLRAGADILDIGGYSTRPGATEVMEDEEIARVVPAVEEIRTLHPDALISVDTFRAPVAAKCIEAGADIINDIGSGTLDPGMFETVARYKVPYVLMHTRGTPATMPTLTEYGDVTAEVLSDLAFKADRLRQLGVCDVIIDPGFGFAKTKEQNFRLLGMLRCFTAIGPVLAGLSRKRMIFSTLGTGPEEALNGTTVLNTLALLNGASILRVHDVREAAEAVRLHAVYEKEQPHEQQVITTTFSDNSRSTLIV